jgi:formate dehydrogenase subunit gamma
MASLLEPAHPDTRLTAPQPAARIKRFTVTERALHWMHASAFFALLATGMILYLPALSTLVNRRVLVRDIHIWVALAWAIALVVILVVGNRKRLAEDWREIETIDRDDRRWLRGRKAPQGRFNAGQKVNALLTIAFALLFALSGFFLWLGERDHRFIFAGTGTVHDALTFASIGLLVGHLYLALIHPSTRHALRGMTVGDVDEAWAKKHHAKWVEAERIASTHDEPTP